MEKEAEVFGNRTISGFLSQVGAEEAMASDQVIWSEQGRLHIKADLVAVATPGTGECTLADHPFRVGDTVVAHATGGTGVGLTIKGYVSAVPSTSTFNVLPYTSNTLTTAGFDATTEFTMFVYGSEYVLKIFMKYQVLMRLQLVGSKYLVKMDKQVTYGT